MKPPESFQNLKSVGINDNRNDITLRDIYAENKSQKRKNETDIYVISIDVKNETENREEHNHKIEEKNEDTL